jgi:hypothetical protein
MQGPFIPPHQLAGFGKFQASLHRRQKSERDHYFIMIAAKTTL